MQIRYLIPLIIFCYSVTTFGQEHISLEQCRQLSLDFNRQLKSENYRLQVAQSNTQAAKKDRYFNLDGSSNFIYNAQKVTNEGASVHERHLYRVGINANQVIYGGGKIKNTIELNQLMEKEGSAYVNLSELDVIYSADNIYWNAVSSNEYVLYWKRYLLYLDEFIQVVDERVQSGLVGQNDLLTAKLRYNEGEIALANAKANYNRSISQLCTSIGKPVNSQLLVEDSLSLITILPDTIQVFSNALSSRPEIEISEYQSKSIDLQRELIKSEYRISLNAGININYGNQINNDNDAANFIGLATLGIPINRWGKKRDQLGANNYQSLITEEKIEATKEAIHLEIQLAFISLEEALSQIEIASKAKENARENLKIANNKYREGLSSIIEVTDAQTILQNAVISYIQSKANYYFGLTAYNRAIANF